MRLEGWLLAPVLAGCASIQSISRPPPTSEQCEVRRVGGAGDDGASEGLVLDASGGGRTSLGGAFSGPGAQYCREVTLDREGEVWMTGAFSQRIQLGGFVLESAGSNDILTLPLIGQH